MKETLFKKRVFWLLLGAKLIVILYLLINSGGMTSSETLATIGLILPLFMVYLVPMIQNFSKNLYETPKESEEEGQQQTEKVEKNIKKWVVSLTFILLPLYTLVLLLIITLSITGSLGGDAQANFANMQASIGVVESMFGVYLGPILAGLFPKK